MKITLPLIFVSMTMCACAGSHVPQAVPKNIVGDSPATGAVRGDSELDEQMDPLPGIYRMDDVLNLIGSKKVAVVSNHTGLIHGTHLVDTLIASGVRVVSVFAPEHGFRGDRPDGEKIKSQTDHNTGLPVYSLYGTEKKPTPQQLKGAETVVFDIQDVGARFYTYLSTLHYVMEACAEAGLPVIVLDRPNPNIGYVDGPVLDMRFSSFVGMHPVPVVYGMTIGEYAQMINGEGWLDNGIRADLHVVPCSNYTRTSTYTLPVAPSPNLPDMISVYLYPSLCFFEATTVSVGRGTPHPFSVVGEPGNHSGDYTFVPMSVPGASTHPKHRGETCRGYNLAERIPRPKELNRLDLSWLLRMYRETENPSGFFDRSEFFDKLAGTDRLRKAVVAGQDAEEIRDSWQIELDQFRAVRSKYLIYP